ncbi:MAG: AlpA family phage regulatory protein [Pseudohongiella sp.]|nr:AlpA family phage regulatory protein [Pseudohongiella sp.]
MAQSEELRLLRRLEVEMVTGFTTGSLYAAMAKGTFPKPLRIGRNSVAWISTEVEAWREARIADRDAGKSQPNSNLLFHIRNIPTGKRMLRRKDVLYRTGKSQAAVYKDISLGLFPEPISISDNTSVWLESEINAWIQERLNERNQSCVESRTSVKNF